MTTIRTRPDTNPPVRATAHGERQTVSQRPSVAAGAVVKRESASPGDSLTELREYCVRVARRFGALQTAEDVAQDAMMAFLVAGRVREPHAWLRTVVRRLVSRRYRESRPCQSVDEITGDDSPRCASPADDIVLFRQILRRLPARDRRVLVLKLRGYSYGEMARRLGCRRSAVGTTVNRTFVRVRRILEPCRY